MAPFIRQWWLFALGALAIASAASLAVLSSGSILPSVVREPIAAFVQPGVTVWWLLLGGPFRTAPTSATGITFAAGTNATLWVLALWLGVATMRAARRKFARPRS
jgi:hypothetical protein